MSASEIAVVEDPAAIARTAAALFVEEAAAAAAARGRFMVALSGGSTPGRLYQRLAGTDEGERSEPAIDWRSVHVFWGDERWVPPHDPQSNFRMARDLLLDHVPIPAPQVHRIESEHQDPAEAAARYEREIRRVFGGTDLDVPALDLVLLGLGRDGHTASLFPGTPLLNERRHLVAAEWVRAVQDWRITFTPPMVRAARLLVFLVSGAGKADAVAAVFGCAQPSTAVPAAVVAAGARRVRWILDRAAAARLPVRPDAGRGAEPGR